MAAKKQSDRVLTKLEALNVWDSRGVYPQSVWVEILGVSRKLISEIQNGKEYADILPSDLDSAEFEQYRKDHERMRSFACAVGQLKKKTPLAVKEKARASIQGKQIAARDDLLSLPAPEMAGSSTGVAANMTGRPVRKQVQSMPPTPQPIATNKSTPAEFLPASDEAYHTDGDGYDVVDDPDEPYDEVDDSADAPAPAPALTLNDLRQVASAMNAANDN